MAFVICTHCKIEQAGSKETSYNKSIQLLGDKYEAALLREKAENERLRQKINQLKQKRHTDPYDCSIKRI